MSAPRPAVLRFSLGDDITGGLRAAVSVVKARGGGVAVMVGAGAGVRATMARVVAMARARDDGYRDVIDATQREQGSWLRATLPAASAAELAALVEEDARDLADACHAIRGGAGGDTAAARALVTGAGAHWSSRALAALLVAEGVAARWRDARDVLRATGEDVEGVAGALDLAEGACVVLPLGVAASPAGEPVTLPLAGEDRTAAALASLVDAREVELWSPGGSVYTAPPALVPGVRALAEVTLAEACALAGASGASWSVAGWTSALARGRDIALRDLDAPGLPGTRVVASPRGRSVVAASLREGLCLLRAMGDNVAALPLAAQTTLGALRYVGAEAVMVLHAAPGDGHAVLVPTAQSAARSRVEHAWRWEDRGRHVQRVDHEDASLVAVIGEGAAHDPVTAARFFTALATTPLLAFGSAGGAALAAAVPPERGVEALRALHAAFGL